MPGVKSKVKNKAQSTRRAGSLRPQDYDHEIDLLDHDGSDVRNQERQSTEDAAEMSRSSTNAELLQHRDDSVTPDEERARKSPTTNGTQNGSRSGAGPTSNAQQHEYELPHDALQPSISSQDASPNIFHDSNPQVKPKRPRAQRETVIDILYENERGGFLCGAALFSATALGGLDATSWTNAYHYPSPTSIYTATVPDPSWEWVWPEWRVNHQEGMDEGGWEYSFAFSKKFSWHGPKWWNSFVRRRAWIRKRAKKPTEEISTDLHSLNTDYFFVRSASARMRQSCNSFASSRAPSNAPSMSQISSVSGEPTKLHDVHDIKTLLQILRKARIDREKLEACGNYLEHGLDLEQLTSEMHNIMGLFVFQASRRLLLGQLIHTFDSAAEQLEKKNDAVETHFKTRHEALRNAVKHADEEVRRLAYWSDVKQMTGNGETHAMEERKGWDAEKWEGIDQSGPGEPMKGKLPSG